MGRIKIRILKKGVSLLLALEILIAPVAAQEQKNKSKNAKSTWSCGDFEVIPDLDASMTTNVCRNDNGQKDKRYKTPGGKVEVHVSESLLNSSKNLDQVLDRVLLDLIRDKIGKKFSKKLAQIDASYGEDVPRSSKKSFHDAYVRMQNKILDDGKAPKHQVRKLLALFPEIQQEIGKENPAYKTLLCRYESWKHTQRVVKEVVLGLSILELAAFVAAAPLAAGVVMTANIDRAFLLSQILMVGGMAGVLGGALEIENKIANWDQVTAAKNARMLLKFYRNVQKEIDHLNKDPEKNRDKILELQKWLPSEPEMQQLEETRKKQFKEYKGLFIGLSKFGLGVAMLYGGEELYKMLSTFEKDSPPSDPSSGSVDPPWMK